MGGQASHRDFGNFLQRDKAIGIRKLVMAMIKKDIVVESTTGKKAVRGGWRW